MKISRSIKIPGKVKAGQPVKAADHNAILDALSILAEKLNDMIIRPSADIGLKPDGSPGQVLFIKHPRGGGGGIISKTPPLNIVSSRPSYVPQPPALVAANHARFYMTWGMVNGILPDNWSDCLDVPTSEETRRYIDMKAFLAPEGEYVVVTRCEWVTYTQTQKDANAFVTPKYANNGDRPEFMYIPIGMIEVAAPAEGSENGAVSILNDSSGSIRILEYVSTIDYSAQGGVKYKKALNPTRLPY